jgi:small subunit ribosomal protein S9
MERAQEHEAFMAERRVEYQVGRRHLANMMGIEESMMTQDDVDAAVRYLFPSGIFEPKARPFLRDPEDVS